MQHHKLFSLRNYRTAVSLSVQFCGSRQHFGVDEGQKITLNRTLCYQRHPAVYRIHERLPLDTVIDQINPIHAHLFIMYLLDEFSTLQHMSYTCYFSIKFPLKNSHAFLFVSSTSSLPIFVLLIYFKLMSVETFMQLIGVISVT
jgi:hypothetical protein